MLCPFDDSLARVDSRRWRDHVLLFPSLEVAVHRLVDFGVPIGKAVVPYPPAI